VTSVTESDFDVKALFQGGESRSPVEGINRLLKLRQKFRKLTPIADKVESAMKGCRPIGRKLGDSSASRPKFLKKGFPGG